jgi:hypothetical protein
VSDITPRPSKQPPEIGPYVFPGLLALFGLWCAYDGWLNTSPEIQDHLLFNRILSVILLPWAAWDFRRMKKRKREKTSAAEDSSKT